MKPRWAPTSELIEIQGEIDRMMQKRGLGEWQAMSVCSNLIATVICHSFHDQKSAEKRQVAVKTICDNIIDMVAKAPFIDDNVEIEDWQRIDPRKAQNYKFHWSPALNVADVDSMTGVALGHGIKLTKDCEAQIDRGCVTWMPMHAQNREWAIVLMWIRDSKPWDLIIVESDEKAREVCRAIGVDQVPPDKLWKQPTNNLRASYRPKNLL